MIPFSFWLVLIIAILLGHYLLDLIVERLNLKALRSPPPTIVETVYDQKEYEKSIRYQQTRTTFSLFQSTVTTMLTLAFLLVGGFGVVNQWALRFGFSEIATGLIFGAILVLLSFVVSVPFSIYSTFVIEERYGFNRTSPATFIADIGKGALLTVLLGGPLFALVQWFFIRFDVYGWLYCWLGVVIFSLTVQFLAPVLILPLFNKYTPLPEGGLRDKLIRYARKESFAIQGIFTMDGSKRSTKLNAFFTGFGKFRKIVLFDTLLEKLDEDEILTVLAHEMGHYKLKHIPKMITASIVQTGIMFFLLSIFLNYPEISLSFGVERATVYSSLIFFGFLYSPMSTFISVIFNTISRKHEYAADEYAAVSTGRVAALMSGLIKLARANLTPLTPHPLKVAIYYSHPPLSSRLQRLKEISQDPEEFLPTH